MVKYFAVAEWPECHRREMERENSATGYDVISTRKADIRRFARQAIKDGATCVDVLCEVRSKDYGDSFGLVAIFNQDNPKGGGYLGDF